MSRYKLKGDVAWRLPNRKRPFAYSTVATNDLIVVLAEEHSTIKDVYDNINYDADARRILAEYIKAGYGDCIARDYFR